MSIAGARILVGMVVVGAIAVAIPDAAYAQNCSSGNVASGGIQSQSFTLDATQMANFTVDSSATDLAMQVIDDQKNVACLSSLTNGGHLSCGWMPVSGAVYTVQVMRPADPNLVAAATSAPDANNDDGNSVAAGPGNGLGGPTESYDLCQQETQ